jgi:hypothetical protein
LPAKKKGTENREEKTVRWVVLMAVSIAVFYMIKGRDGVSV